MKKKYLETLQMNISNSYYEKRKHTCIFKQHGLFNSFVHVFFSAYCKTRNTRARNIGSFQMSG